MTRSDTRRLNVTDLAASTKTNIPCIHAPAEYFPTIASETKKYLKNFAFHFVDSELLVCLESQDEYAIVRNRIENLIVAGITDGFITSPAEISFVTDHNLSFTAAEERAIIEAYKNGSELAKKYIFVFFSHKVVAFMRTSNLLCHSSKEDIFCRLQQAIFDAIDAFDTEKIQHGGMSKSYLNQFFMDVLRDQIFAKELSNVAYSRAQTEDLNKIRKLSDEELSRMTADDIAQTCGVSRNVVFLHIMTACSTSLDAPVPGGYEQGCKATQGDFVSNRTDDIFAAEQLMDLEMLMQCLKEDGISAETVKTVLSYILDRTYSKAGQTNRKNIRKISRRVYSEISARLHVPVKTVEIILSTFATVYA